MKRGLKNQYVAWMALVATLGLVDVAHARDDVTSIGDCAKRETGHQALHRGRQRAVYGRRTGGYPARQCQSAYLWAS